MIIQLKASAMHIHCHRISCIALFLVFVITLPTTYAQDQKYNDARKPQVYTNNFKNYIDITNFENSDIVIAVHNNDIAISKNNGKTWEKSDNFKCPSPFKCDYYTIETFEYHPNTVFITSTSPRVFYSFDSGETWDYVDLPISTKKKTYMGIDISLNYANSDYILFQIFINNNKGDSLEETYYTDDKFKTKPKLLGKDLINCEFTKSNPLFTNGNDEDIICSRGLSNSNDIDMTDELVFSTDFFKSNIVINKNLKDFHIWRIDIKGPFIIVQINVDLFSYSSFYAFISKDGINFKKCYFDGFERSKYYNTLYATENSIYITQQDFDSQNYFTRSLFKSNSDGQYFTKVVESISGFNNNRLMHINSLDGVWITSKFVEHSRFGRPDSKSQITFNDGATWSYLNVTGDDYNECTNDEECSLHITGYANFGFENSFNNLNKLGNNQGILIAPGTVGKFLSSNEEEMHTFISRDNGLTWSKLMDDIYTPLYGNYGNIIILTPEGRRSDKNRNEKLFHIMYSLDQGLTWSKYEFDFADDSNNSWTYTVNNVFNNVLILASNNYKDKITKVLSIDFSNSYDRNCEDSDMETWSSRIDPVSNKPSCVFGHSETSLRRKPESKCFIDQLPNVIDKPCECTKLDYECNSGFSLDDEGNCEPVLDILAQYCESNQKSVKLSKKRKIPGNICQGGFTPPTNDYTFRCKNANDAKEKNSIKVKLTPFGDNVEYYKYLAKNTTLTSYQEETLIVLTESKDAFISFNGGENFAYVSDTDEKIINVVTNPYWPDSIYLISEKGMILSSLDRGKTFYKEYIQQFQPENSKYTFSFNSFNPRSYILIHHVNCDDKLEKCDYFAFITKDNGQSFTKLADNANNCIYKLSYEMFQYHENVICSIKTKNSDFISLIRINSNPETNDDSPNKNIEILGNLLEMINYNDYIIVTKLKQNGAVTASVSLDGKTFADVKFPYDLSYETSSNYSLLHVNSKELYFYVTTNNVLGHEYGSILKGNFNGTLFSTIVNHVNQNSFGDIDFENIGSTEGYLLVNIVSNPIEVQNGGEKKLVTKMSFNNGGSWSNIPAPVKIRKNNNWNLHFQLATDKLDPKHDLSYSNSAVGLLFGLGNAGLQLTTSEDKEELSLFFSKDGGVNWKELFKGNYIWEFGDQGTVLVIAQTLVKTNIVRYSIDYGDNWIEYQFSEDIEYLVEDITTVLSDNAMKFNLIVNDGTGNDSMVTIDFTNVYKRQCQSPFGVENDLGKDYEYFSPLRIQGESCLFGHEVKYLRRKANSDCFIGSAPLNLKTKVVKNCKCTREDYECDYNYELMNDNTCKLISGLKSLKGNEVCQSKFVSEWWEPTGYRKLAMSTCQNGLVLDKLKGHSCYPWIQRNRLRGQALFWVIFIPITTFIISCIVIYDRGIRRRGGFRRLGEIRLDRDDNLIIGESRWYDSIVDPIVGFGVFMYHVLNMFVESAKKIFSKKFGRNETDSSGANDNDFVDGNHNDESLFGADEYHDDAQEIEN